MPEGSGSGVGTIVDNDNPPSAQIGDVTVAEGNSWNRDGTPERAAVEPERQADRRPDLEPQTEQRRLPRTTTLH